MSKIQWTDQTWNPITGCTKISQGCKFCYAEGIANRFKGGAFPNGFELTLRPDRLSDPLSWSRPRMVFVNSMSDVFHEDVPTDYIKRIWDVMKRTPSHTYQVLTKRATRMMNSAEPLLEDWLSMLPAWVDCKRAKSIQWLILGGESGPKARPCEPSWIQNGIDAASIMELAPFVKQLGSHWARTSRSRDSKGGDPLEWPEELRVGEWPTARPLEEVVSDCVF